MTQFEDWIKDGKVFRLSEVQDEFEQSIEESVETILNAMDDGLITTVEKPSVFTVNPQYLNILGEQHV